MTDTRYLDGDPNEPQECFHNFGPTLQATQQTLALICDLLQRDDNASIADARAAAASEWKRINTVLTSLELTQLPQIDIVRSSDVLLSSGRVYKKRNTPPDQSG